LSPLVSFAREKSWQSTWNLEKKVSEPRRKRERLFLRDAQGNGKGVDPFYRKGRKRATRSDTEREKQETEQCGGKFASLK